jgi:hypothetical protein
MTQKIEAKKLLKARRIASRCSEVDCPLPEWVRHLLFGPRVKKKAA